MVINSLAELPNQDVWQKFGIISSWTPAWKSSPKRTSRTDSIGQLLLEGILENGFDPFGERTWQLIQSSTGMAMHALNFEPTKIYGGIRPLVCRLHTVQPKSNKSVQSAVGGVLIEPQEIWVKTP